MRLPLCGHCPAVRERVLGKRPRIRKFHGTFPNWPTQAQTIRVRRTPSRNKSERRSLYRSARIHINALRPRRWTLDVGKQTCAANYHPHVSLTLFELLKLTPAYKPVRGVGSRYREQPTMLNLANTANGITNFISLRLLRCRQIEDIQGSRRDIATVVRRRCIYVRFWNSIITTTHLSDARNITKGNNTNKYTQTHVTLLHRSGPVSYICL